MKANQIEKLINSHLSEIQSYDPVDPQIRNVVHSAVEALERNDCTVDKISIPIIDDLSPIDATYVLLAGEGVEYLNEYVRGNESDLSDPIRGLLSVDRPDLDTFLKASSVCDSYKYWFTDYFAKYDVLICPTAPNLAPKHDSQIINIDGEQMPASHAAAITCTFGITGSPAISIPFGMSDNGLPIGIQIVTNHYNESTLFDTILFSFVFSFFFIFLDPVLFDVFFCGLNFGNICCFAVLLCSLALLSLWSLNC